MAENDKKKAAERRALNPEPFILDYLALMDELEIIQALYANSYETISRLATDAETQNMNLLNKEIFDEAVTRLRKMKTLLQ